MHRTSASGAGVFWFTATCGEYSSFTVSTMTLIPAPGFTKLDTAKVEPKVC